MSFNTHDTQTTFSMTERFCDLVLGDFFHYKVIHYISEKAQH